MTWCASTGSYLTHIARSCWNCARKVNSSDIYAGCLAFFFLHRPFCRHTLICRHITFFRHSAAGAEAQVTELVKRVKELTGMPDPAVTRIDTLYFKSFISSHCFLSSPCFDFKSFQMIKLHWRHATRTVCPQWMWPSNWTTGMPLTRSRQSS
jgi:hypothetical protein